MSKLSRHNTILALLEEQELHNQDELRRALARKGIKVTQATLSRDIRDLQLIKTAQGYRTQQAEAAADPALPSADRLVREFVREVREAQNLLVLKTSIGSAQPVAAALDAEEWPDVVGTVAGDDTILVISDENRSAQKLAQRIRELIA